MTTLKPFDAAESSMRQKLNRLFELRAETIELRRKQAEIAKVGNTLFKQFQKEFKISLKVKPEIRKTVRKLKPVLAGN